MKDVFLKKTCILNKIQIQPLSRSDMIVFILYVYPSMAATLSLWFFFYFHKCRLSISESEIQEYYTTEDLLYVSEFCTLPES